MRTMIRPSIAALLLAFALHPLSAGAAPAAKTAPKRPAAAKPASKAATTRTASQAAAPAYPHASKRPETLQVKPFTFNPPEARREELPNGLVVYLQEDHDLPLFNIIAYTKVGGIYVPQEKAGLGSLTGTVLRTGGTEEKTGDEIDQALEFVGASVETGIASEYGTASGTSLIKDRDLVLETLNDLLRRPAFRQDKIDLAKGQLLEAIRRQNDDPNSIAGREFARLIYGRESPYARVATTGSVRGITRDDLIQFHRRFYHPNNTILAVSGDFKADEMLAKLRQTFGTWERSPVEYPKFDPVREIEGRKVYTVNRDLPQTVVYLGHLGIRRHSPDKPAVDLMNEIFGGGGLFSSRLVREVRSNRGLAYSVGGGVGVGPDRGRFLVGAQTKSESATEAAGVMANVINEMRSQPVSNAEVSLAKDAILNSYVFQFESPFQIVSQYAQMELLGFPRDYLKTYPERIRAVTPAEIQAAAQKYLHPDRLVFLFVGRTEGVQPAITTLGPVTPLQLDPVEEPPTSQQTPDEQKVP